ncbi:hypothetical protein N7499_006874 [Penicillium canescens]|uniref:Uncharacterized protein n=1 Tax=Penicillium canescens TaxID=5083 RepID=A0AAD6IEC3_PENCN|nr:uncharacterized protein N7446_002563 [Penicillium canescens]KAJ5996811.1 hypothetical protein N7522_008471 [Penicillium canescens]KAJ6044370.1 hypothetical protein N7460_005725 [Penicillium canescens]KAJ6055838.1 hypothetical protein N7444_004936 [Penicillium canescens]KAJ6074786.1 hypothetical protein N7446_002563 [Penicillium canescens]KAJ6082000.1 hypothetical protein N7499_006874 [Penicillium canescens]
MTCKIPNYKEQAGFELKEKEIHAYMHNGKDGGATLAYAFKPIGLLELYAWNRNDRIVEMSSNI